MGSGAPARSGDRAEPVDDPGIRWIGPVAHAVARIALDGPDIGLAVLLEDRLHDADVVGPAAAAAPVEGHGVARLRVVAALPAALLRELVGDPLRGGGVHRLRAGLAGQVADEV